ncbi:uncharacterized protein RCO7_02319 [Rhynchosporium graminicola]|uniref:Uncharacterized protein n=1 Tax=Rhynchosporium graminicola TaxID=2792576 RepID=A0A1E1JWH0_9HELO|nr:uncharacterized protein RCO7_02319 [Rhynchosporium commune]
MAASEEQYSEAWCTHLIRDQQGIIERMAKLLRDQKTIPATGDPNSEIWYSERLKDDQIVIDNMATLLRDQQRTVDLLNQKLADIPQQQSAAGTKDDQTVDEKMAALQQNQHRTVNLMDQKVADIARQQSATITRYHSGHLFGPNSAAITWYVLEKPTISPSLNFFEIFLTHLLSSSRDLDLNTVQVLMIIVYRTGTVMDLVPISVKGKEYKALILTPKFVRSQNDVFESEIAIKMMEPQVSEEHEYFEYIRKLPATDGNEGRDFPLTDDIQEAEFTNDELFEIARDTRARQITLNKFLKRESTVHHRATQYVVGFLRRAFKMNNLARQDDWNERIHFTRLSKIETRKGRHDDGTPVSDREVTLAEYGSDPGSETFGKLEV